MAAACRGSQTPEATVDVAAPLSVSTVVAAVMPIADQLEAGGVVAAKETATLTSRIVAPVIEVRVRAGERVRAGDLLVVLDDKAMADQARAAEAAAGAAEQGLTVATSEQAAAVAERKLATACTHASRPFTSGVQPRRRSSTRPKPACRAPSRAPRARALASRRQTPSWWLRVQRPTPRRRRNRLVSSKHPSMDS